LVTKGENLLSDKKRSQSKRGVIAALVTLLALSALSAVLQLDYRNGLLDSAFEHAEFRNQSARLGLTDWIEFRGMMLKSLATRQGFSERVATYVAGDSSGLSYIQEHLVRDAAAGDHEALYLLDHTGATLVGFEDSDATAATLDDVRSQLITALDATATVVAYPESREPGEPFVLWWAHAVPDPTGSSKGGLAVMASGVDLDERLSTVFDAGPGSAFQESFQLLAADGRVLWGAETTEDVIGDEARVAGTPWSVRALHSRPAVLAGANVLLLVNILSVIAVAALVGVGVSYLDRVRAEAEFEREARQRVSEALATEERFLANMSHEFRTPLQSMIGFTHIMLDGAAGEITEEQQRQLTMVNNSSKRLLGLVNDLLDFSRVRAGKLEVTPVQFTAKDLVEHLRGVFCPLLQEKNLECLFVDDDATIELETDQGLVERVLMNLVANAVKFTMEGSVSLHIRTDGALVSFEVRDTGPGIPAGEIPHVTEEFHRAGGSTSALQGTGLGLAISDEIARALGGQLEIASEVGVGSVFTLTIPRVYAGPATPQSPRA